MAIIFPGDLLRPRSLKPALIGQTVGGGATLVGPEQVAELSAGGFWTLDYDLGDRRNPTRLKVLRALLTQMRGGAVEIVMPFCDEPQAPWPAGVRPGTTVLTPFSDGATFSDGSRFSQSPIVFQLEAAIEENATEAVCRRLAGADLVGGEFFTLVHAEAGDRAYCLGEVEALAPDLFRIGFGPPARGPSAAGESVDFANPRCTMRLQTASGEAWPTVTAGWKASASWRFVEDFDYLKEA